MERLRVHPGQFAPQPGAADLRELMRDSVEAARPAADAKRVGVTVETGLLPVSAGNREELARLFDYLVVTAVSSEPECGRVCIRLYERDGWAQAEVQGAGSYAPPQAEVTILKAIVDAHGGRMDISIRAGEGTNYTVFLPLRCTISPLAAR